LNEGKEEILAYFPEGTEIFNKVEENLNREWDKIYSIWEQHHKIPVQKDFALAIKDTTPFTGILFSLRKQYGDKQTAKHLKEMWKQSAGRIAECLY